MEFHYEADREFFRQRLCEGSEELSRYAELFDFRPPRQKRAEFDRYRSTYLAALIERFGRCCMLQIAPDCNVASGLNIDHIIPLSSNVLNKLLRSARTSRDKNGRLKKALTQSIGSNHRRNLVLACHNCNSMKKNRLLDSGVLRRVLSHVALAEQAAAGDSRDARA
jgi:5-methylcytosine-specific restriction endonuclease McrA